METTLPRASHLPLWDPPEREPDPPVLRQIAAYEKKIRSLASRVVKVEAYYQELLELRKIKRELTDRLHRARNAKLRAEEKEAEYRVDLAHLKSEYKASFQELWEFAHVCQQQAEEARSVLQRAVRTNYPDGSIVLTHTCTGCREAKPIRLFPVRTTRSGNICFGSHCLECKNARLRQARASVQRGGSLRDMATAIVQQAPPALVNAIAEGIEEMQGSPVPSPLQPEHA